MTKYRNRRVRTEEGAFDSEREYRRWCDLKLLAKAMQIAALTRRVEFELAPACVIGGRRRRAMKYVADFSYYIEGGKRVVEDSKGYRNRVYLLKRHLMMTVHGIEILET